MFKNCKNCFFVEAKHGKQTGCKIGKLKKFQQVTKSEVVDGYYQLGRLCFFGRSPKWAEKNGYDNLDQKLAEEVKIRYSLIVVVKSEADLAEFRNNYGPYMDEADYIIVLNYIGEGVQGILDELGNDERVKIATPTPEYDADEVYLAYEKMIQYVDRSRFVWMIQEPSERPRASIIEELNTRINDNLEMIVGIVGEGHCLILKELLMLVIKNSSVSLSDYLEDELANNNPMFLKVDVV